MQLIEKQLICHLQEQFQTSVRRKLMEGSTRIILAASDVLTPIIEEKIIEIICQCFNIPYVGLFCFFLSEVII